LILEIIWGYWHSELFMISWSVVCLPFAWRVLVRWERHTGERIKWHSMGWQHVWRQMTTLLVECM